MKTRGRDGREEATSPGTPGAPRSWKRREGPSPGASGGTAALGHLDLRRLVPRMGEGAYGTFRASPFVAMGEGRPRTLTQHLGLKVLNPPTFPPQV